MNREQFFKELLNVLDAMPDKELISERFMDGGGRCCAIGAFALAKGVDSDFLRHTDKWHTVTDPLGVERGPAGEVMLMNDTDPSLTRKERWSVVRYRIVSELRRSGAIHE